MTGKEPITPSSWVGPDEAPKLYDTWFEKADLTIGDKLSRRGRPAGSGNKQQITLRLDREVIEHFRATGEGWQSRINETLVKAIREKE